MNFLFILFLASFVSYSIADHFVCPKKFGNFQNVKNICKTYWQCTNGVSVLKRCSSILEFSPTARKCINPNVIKCNAAVTTTSNQLASTTTLSASTTTLPPNTAAPLDGTSTSSPSTTTPASPTVTSPSSIITPQSSTTTRLVSTTTLSASTASEPAITTTQPASSTTLASTTEKPAGQPENLLNSVIVKNGSVNLMSTTSIPILTTTHDKPVSLSSEISTPPAVVTTLSTIESTEASSHSPKLLDMITSPKPFESSNERATLNKDKEEINSHVTSTQAPINDATQSTLFVTVSEEPIVKSVAFTVKPIQNQSAIIHEDTNTTSNPDKSENEAQLSISSKANSSSTLQTVNEIPISSLKKSEILFKDEDDMVIEDIGLHNADDDNMNTMNLDEELEQKEKEKKAKKEANDSEISDKVKPNNEEEKKSNVDPIVKLIVPSLQTTNKSSELPSSTMAPVTVRKEAAELEESFTTTVSSSPSSINTNLFTTLLPLKLSFLSADSNPVVSAMPTTVDPISLSTEEVPSASSTITLSIMAEKSGVEDKKLLTINSSNTTPQSELTTTTPIPAIVTTTADSVSHSMPAQPEEDTEFKPITNESIVDSSATDAVLNLFKEVPVKRTEGSKISENELENTLSNLGSNLTELINTSRLPNVKNKVVPVLETDISEIKEVLEQFNNILNHTSSIELHSNVSKSSVDTISSTDTLTTPLPTPINISSLSYHSSENMAPSFEEPVTLSVEASDGLVKLINESDVNPHASENVNNKDEKVLEDITESSDKQTEPSVVIEVGTSNLKETNEGMSSTEAATTVSVMEEKKESTQTESGLKFDGINFICLSDGIFKHPTKCTKFIFCASGSPMLSECPLGLGWNSKHSTCDILKNSDCTSVN